MRRCWTSKRYTQAHALIGDGWHFGCVGVLKVAVLADVELKPEAVMAMDPKFVNAGKENDLLHKIVVVPRDGRCLSYVLLLGLLLSREEQDAWQAAPYLVAILLRFNTRFSADRFRATRRRHTMKLI